MAISATPNPARPRRHRHDERISGRPCEPQPGGERLPEEETEGTSEPETIVVFECDKERTTGARIGAESEGRDDERELPHGSWLSQRFEARGATVAVGRSARHARRRPHERGKVERKVTEGGPSG